MTEGTNTDYESLKITLTIVGVVIGLIGAITGTTSLIWRLIDEYKGYLKISVTTEVLDSGVSFLTKVENTKNKAKRIDSSILVIGPYEESPIETVNKLCGANNLPIKVQYTNSFKLLKLEHAIKDSLGRVIIPLSFYYSENVGIGDEELTYKAYMDRSTFKTNSPYSVRFFIFGENRLHRSTHDTFIITEP